MSFPTCKNSSGQSASRTTKSSRSLLTEVHRQWNFIHSVEKLVSNWIQVFECEWKLCRKIFCRLLFQMFIIKSCKTVEQLTF